MHAASDLASVEAWRRQTQRLVGCELFEPFPKFCRELASKHSVGGGPLQGEPPPRVEFASPFARSNAVKPPIRAISTRLPVQLLEAVERVRIARSKRLQRRVSQRALHQEALAELVKAERTRTAT
jgi:hypothetical protein